MLSFKAQKSHKTYTIAHRGASAYEHENTIAAFQKAIELGADGIELDVRKTKDNVLVVHHDVCLKSQKQTIAEMTFSDIKRFNKQSEYQIPTLKETLKFCQDKISLDIELKESGYEELVVKMAINYYEKENLLFTSFDKNTVEAIYMIDNNLHTGYPFHKPILLKTIPENVEYLLPHISLCKIGYLKKLVKLSKPIIVWTVDNEKTKKKLIIQNVFGLITNDPI